jgi:NADP-dependent 3-hydroxy acid dehydrogenase YdfG
MRSRKCRSAIINLSSSSAIRPLPNFAIYGATKVFSFLYNKTIKINKF